MLGRELHRTYREFGGLGVSEREVTLGQYVRHLRNEKNVSLEEAAHRIGIDRSGLGRIEKGHVEPRPDTLASILGYYEKDMDAYKAFAKQRTYNDLGRALYANFDPESVSNQFSRKSLEKIRFAVNLGLSLPL